MGQRKDTIARGVRLGGGLLGTSVSSVAVVVRLLFVGVSESRLAVRGRKYCDRMGWMRGRCIIVLALSMPMASTWSY